MRKIVLIALIGITSLFFASFANSEDQISKETESYFCDIVLHCTQHQCKTRSSGLQYRFSRTGELRPTTFWRNLERYTDHESWFSVLDIFELRKDINIRPKLGEKYDFFLQDVRLVIADVELHFWLRYPYAINTVCFVRKNYTLVNQTNTRLSMAPTVLVDSTQYWNTPRSTWPGTRRSGSPHQLFKEVK